MHHKINGLPHFLAEPFPRPNLHRPRHPTADGHLQPPDTGVGQQSGRPARRSSDVDVHYLPDGPSSHPILLGGKIQGSNMYTRERRCPYCRSRWQRRFYAGRWIPGSNHSPGMSPLLHHHQFHNGEAANPLRQSGESTHSSSISYWPRTDLQPRLFFSGRRHTGPWLWVA